MHPRDIIKSSPFRKPRSPLSFFILIIFLIGLLAALLLVRTNQNYEKDAATPQGSANFTITPGSSNLTPNQNVDLSLTANAPNKKIDGIQITLNFSGKTPEDIRFIPENIPGLTNVTAKLENGSLKLALITQNPAAPFNLTSLKLGTIKFTSPANDAMKIAFDTTQSKIIENQTSSDILLTPNVYTYNFKSTTITPTPTRTPSPNPTITPSPRLLPTSPVTPRPIPQTPFPKLTPTPAPAQGTGLKAVYYNNTKYDGSPKIVRTDPKIDFNWRYGGPSTGVGFDTFAVEWNGYVLAPYTGSYTFYTQSDDGVYFWINNKLSIEDWRSHPVKENSTTINLQAGTKYKIRLQYYDRYGAASIKVLWSHQNIKKEVIPQKYLFPS
jgi:hypothetical protein